MENSRNRSFIIFTFLTAFFAAAIICSAQTTQFAYQGKLNDGGVPANGTYDLQFKLFDSVTAGAQQGVTITFEDVTVTNGVFSVQLDFGAAALPGASRFVDIGVRPGANNGAFTSLAPRQQVTSAPYAVKSLNSTNADTANNAANLGGVAANQYVQTSDQ